MIAGRTLLVLIVGRIPGALRVSRCQALECFPHGTWKSTSPISNSQFSSSRCDNKSAPLLNMPATTEYQRLKIRREWHEDFQPGNILYVRTSNIPFHVVPYSDTEAVTCIQADDMWH